MPIFGSLSRAARVYVVLISATGAGVLAAAIGELVQAPPDPRWLLLVGLTLFTGSITVKVPSVAATLSVSEVFVFSAVMLFGWPAGTVMAALDGLVISLWLQRKQQPGYRLLFNASAPALSIWIAAGVYQALGGPLLSNEDFRLSLVVLPLLAFAATYFLANTSLIAFAIALEQKLSAFKIWKQNFMWLWLNFFSGASMAALLVSFAHREGADGLGAIWIVLPLLGVSYFTYKTSMARIEDANKHLDKLNSLYLSTIETLAMAIDAKDQITHGHIRRVQAYAVALAKEVGINDQQQIKAIEAAALLHDMGKLAVPEYILNKPGPLTPAEFDRMKSHAAVGADILSAIDFPYPVVPIVRHHHEHWDGGGYPTGLKGTEIPIGARVLSVVDCFDALTSDRPYRPRLSDDEALQVLRDRRGSMYDPIVVDAFLSLYGRMRRHDAASQVSPTASGGLWLSTQTTSYPRLAAISASAEESRAMYRLTQRLAAQQSYAEIWSDVVREIANLIPAVSVAFYSFDQERGELEITHVAGSYQNVLLGRSVRMGERIVGWTASSGRSVMNADAQGEFGELAREPGLGLRSCLTVPVSGQAQEKLGVIAAFSPNESGFRTDDQRLIEAIIRHVAPIIARFRPTTQSSDYADSGSSGFELTPHGLIACRCVLSTVAGTEAIGVALGVIRRHVKEHAVTQIIQNNDIFVGTDVVDPEANEELAEGLRSNLIRAGLIASAQHVVVATTPRDGTNLEHLLYVCKQRLAPAGRQPRIH